MGNLINPGTKSKVTTTSRFGCVPATRCGRSAAAALLGRDKTRPPGVVTVKDDLLAGRERPSKGKWSHRRQSLQSVLATKQLLLETHELTPRTWFQLLPPAAELVSGLGKTKLVDD